MRAQLMPYLLIFAVMRLEQWKLPRTSRESLDHGRTEPRRTLMMALPGLTRPAACLAPWELCRVSSNPGDRPRAIGTISRPQLPMLTPSNAEQGKD